MKEIRSFNDPIKRDEESRHIQGMAIVFNSLSDNLGGFREIILPTAIDEELLNKSDVFALFDHDQQRGFLARSRKGEGTLKLTIKENGLEYDFDCPNSPLGNEVMEYLKRGEITQSSFAFTIAEDGEKWEEQEDGTILRTITKINELFDVSLVTVPAYSESSVSLRNLENFKNEMKNKRNEELEDEKIVDKEEQVEPKEEEVVETEETKDNDHKEEEQVEPKEEEVVETKEVEDNDSEKEEQVEPKEEEVVEEDNDQKEEKHNLILNKPENKRMKNFSLVKAINSVVEHRELDDTAKEVVREARKGFMNSGINYNGEIQLPITEKRDGIDSTAAAKAIPTFKTDILEALRANLVLEKAGMTIITDAKGNLSIPNYSGSNCGWAGETAAAQDGKGTFADVEYTPKRLTAFIDVSKQLLAQDSLGVEQMLMNDIVKAVSDKIEATVLGEGAGDTNTPAGLYKAAGTAVAMSYAKIVEMEQALEDKNVSGNFKFIVNPATKAKMKTTPIAAGDSRMIMEGGEANGYEVLTTSNAKGALFGNFADLVLVMWGNAFDITVDPYSQAANGKVRLVVNTYVDVKPRRNESFVAKKFS